MTTEPEHETAQPTPPPLPPARQPTMREKLETWMPTKGQAAVAAIALLAVSNVAAWVKIVREDQPMIVTVGVREMSQGYVSRLALSDITPEEARVKTEMFLAVTQDTVRRAAASKNVLLLARECVLAGETADITKEVGDAVQLALAEASGGSRPAALAAPTPTAAGAP